MSLTFLHAADLHLGSPFTGLALRDETLAQRFAGAISLPGNVFQFPTKPKTVRIEELEVALHGRSFSDRAMTENIVLDYPDPVPGWFNIGILHTSCEGRPGHANYAPCAVSQLKSLDYQYWALGHVHEYEELAWDPWIVFPGNLQGRSIRECGPKGAVLVDVADGRVAAVRRLIVDQARWAVVAVDLDGISEGSEALQKIEDEIRPATEQAEGRLLAVRVHLTRAAALNHAIKADPRSFSDEVQAAADRCGEDVWVESLRIEAAETPVFTSSSDAVGSLDLDTAVTPLLSDPALRKNAADLIAEITAKLPRGLHTNDPPLPDDLDGLLNDARSLVLGRVSPER